MKHYPYLIIGGGMTADAAARAIREFDPTAALGLISADPYPPYARPPLSKGLWKGDPESTIWRGTENIGVDLQLGRRVTAMDPVRKIVIDDRGHPVTFGRPTGHRVLPTVARVPANGVREFLVANAAT
jgi:NADPH-dependent 2,4-dienoyl-CoA reductase/sulfur reductase-like enzyme